MTAAFIHETVVVDEPARIGDGTKIWHFSHVSENAAIGANFLDRDDVRVFEL